MAAGSTKRKHKPRECSYAGEQAQAVGRGGCPETQGLCGGDAVQRWGAVDKQPRGRHRACRAAQNVTNSVVERVKTEDGEDGEEKYLLVLRNALEKIQKHLNMLKRRRRGVSFVLAAKDKDQFASLHLALDQAVQVFTSSQTIKGVDLVRTHSEDFATIKATVTSVGRM
ncbi:hypothetical protein B0H16DRAFT_1448544 [Mycena metata]|uniref:Uncharacterized protein n=1 Tax=Mycena metata TaxID=1033252 RepID=A0AAD7K5Y4_9AGAR|nr:hypothetical protein B0H16DRAFT_1448544 [Mycena metata]